MGHDALFPMHRGVFEYSATHSIYRLFVSDSVADSAVVAPQGFTGIENKEDTWIILRLYPYLYPQKNNTHTPLSLALRWTFWDQLGQFCSFTLPFQSRWLRIFNTR